MAAGIVRRHSPACPSLRDGRCNCGAGYEAWVYLPREKRKVRKTFRRKSEAKAWRADAQSAAARGGLRGTTRDARTLTEALTEFVEGMRAGTIRPKGRERYKPNTIRSYDRAVRVHIAPSKIGDLKVRDMQRSDLQGFADELLALGLSVGTVSNIFNPIQAFCRRAVDRGEQPVNPAEGIDLPNGTSQRPARIASAAEAATLLVRAATGGPAGLGHGVLRRPATWGVAGSPLLRSGLQGEPDPRRARLGPGGRRDRAEVPIRPPRGSDAGAAAGLP